MKPDRLKFFNEGGANILWCDYSRLPESEMIELLIEAAKLGRQSGKRLLILADFAKTPKSKAFNERIKQEGKAYYKDGIDVQVAVLGIDSGLKRVIVNTTMIVTKIKNVKLFENREDAIKWLTKKSLASV